MRDLWMTLVVRGLGGLAGVLPPIVALAFLDKAQYGAAAANVALALLLTGPVNQYVQQGYLRDLVVLRYAGARTRPVGATIIYVYYAFALAVLGILAVLGLPPTDAALSGMLTLLTIGGRVQETHLVAGGQVKTAVWLFYIVPPVLLCLGMILFKRVLPASDFTSVSVAQLLSYAAALALSCFNHHASLAELKPPRWPRTRDAWAGEFRPVSIYFGNGVLLGAAEQVPSLLLRWLGLAAAIPNFEIARKAASVPSLVAHAFGMQLAPRLASSADQKQWPRFTAVLRTYCTLLISVSVAYLLTLVTLTVVLGPHIPLVQQVDHTVSALLLGGALVTAATSPFGAAIVALRAERWLLVGPAVSLVAQLAISFAFFRAYGALAIAAAMVAQTMLSGVVIVLGTAVNLRRRRTAASA